MRIPSPTRVRSTALLTLSVVLAIQGLLPSVALGVTATAQPYTMIMLPNAVLPGGGNGPISPVLPTGPGRVTGVNTPGANQDFNNKKFKNGVFQTAKLNEILTYEPLTIVGTAKDKATIEAYENALLGAKLVMQDWIGQAYANKNDKLKPEQLTRIQGFDADLKAGKISAEQLSATIRGLKPSSQDEFMAYMTDAISSVSTMQTLLDAQEANQEALDKLVDHGVDIRHLIPSAAFLTASFKPPQPFLEWLESIGPVGKGLSWLMQGSVALTVIARPWKVTVQDRATDKIKETYTHIQYSAKIWMNTDAEGKFITSLSTAEGLNARLGAGVILGQIADLDNLSGGFAGLSWDGIIQSARFPSLAKLGNVNIKFGAMAKPDLTNLTVATNGYVMLAKNFGLTPKYQFQGWHPNVGAIFPVASVGQYVTTGLTNITFQSLMGAAPGAFVLTFPNDGNNDGNNGCVMNANGTCVNNGQPNNGGPNGQPNGQPNNGGPTSPGGHGTGRNPGPGLN